MTRDWYLSHMIQKSGGPSVVLPIHIVLPFAQPSRDQLHVVVQSEDASHQQEGLCHIYQQSVRHIVDHDDLIRNQRNATHDEQHRTGILRDFKARVFHSVVERKIFLNTNLSNYTNFFCTWIIRKICEIRVRLLHHHGFACCAEEGSDNVTEDLEYCFYCFVHSVVCF